jgi:hypothetical protein
MVAANAVSTLNAVMATMLKAVILQEIFHMLSKMNQDIA